MAPERPLLELPAPEAARRLVLRQLATARAEAPRLHDPQDEDALHDFRVALRRLRSLLRAWEKELAPAIGRPERDELKAVQGETGGGRDAEVALEWLAEQAEELGPGERPGLDWLRDVLERRLAGAMEHARERVAARFAEADAHLGRRLEEPPEPPTGRASERPFARAAARNLKRHRKKVRRLLLDAGRPPRPARLHSGRIAVKRLRYLVEPLRGETDGAAELVAACKSLQDVLGDLNDAAVFEAELDELAGQAPESARAGLDALRRLNEERHRELLRRLDRGWVEPRLDRLARPARVLVADLKSTKPPRRD